MQNIAKVDMREIIETRKNMMHIDDWSKMLEEHRVGIIYEYPDMIVWQRSDEDHGLMDIIENRDTWFHVGALSRKPAEALLMELFLVAQKYGDDSNGQYEKWKSLPGDNSEEAFLWSRDITEGLKKSLGSSFYVLKREIYKEQKTKGLR
jgi:hypothetical protein